MPWRKLCHFCCLRRRQKQKTAKHRKDKQKQQQNTRRVITKNTALHAHFLLLFLFGCCGVAVRITFLCFSFCFLLLERPRCGDAM